MKKLIVVLAVLLTAGGGIWWASRHIAPEAPTAGSENAYWTCPMHKFIHKDGPGKCPICSMDLVPVKKEGPAPGSPTEAPSTGTVPESEAFKGLAPVVLSPYQEKMIDVKTVKVETMPVTREIRTVGRFAGGSGDFAALASAFIAQEQAKPPSGRYVVADIYALDQPFVRVGQKAWISPLGDSSSKIEGAVAYLYPYDGTQSRVVHVRINLKKPAPTEIYANVEIEASVNAQRAVPREAVLNTGTRSYVYVDDGQGKFTAREVKVGFKGDEYDEITEGLGDGDQVAWDGVFMLDADAHMNAGQE